MIKDKLTEAVEASLKNIKNGDDHIPLNMRGELEVIVKDRDDNIISYERGKNQVTDLAKMAIIHLLAGEIGAVDGGIWSVPETSGTSFQRTYTLSDSDLETSGARIISDFVPDNHTTTTNLDGQLVSNEQYFYDGRDYLDESSNTNQLSQVFAKDTSSPALSLKFNFPTKMLFGTGLEAYNASTMDAEYAREIGTQAANLSLATELKLNGVSNATAVPESFFNGCSYAADTGLTANEKLTNWYSNTKFRSRTLQPATPDAINDSPTSTTTSIRGAIKNCFITNTTDGADRYNASTKMALPEYRGYGYPCFIYAKRSTLNFYVNGDGNHEVNYQMNNALSSTPYETEITYTVDMPAQPVNSTQVTAFYPYNGWVLKQAGLFCDSRFRIRSKDNDPSSTYSETKILERVNSTAPDDTTIKDYRDSAGGQLLFTRNLSSPILKTPDNKITFMWHIFITI